MHEFAEIDGTFAFALIGILLLMAIWGCAVLAIDHWDGLAAHRARATTSLRFLFQ